MREDENITQHSEIIKANVSAIRALGGKIDDVIVVNKVLRTLLPIYAIRVLAIQEMRCDSKNDITLDALVGRLTTFELDNFDNYVPNFGSIESTFQDKLSLKRKLQNLKEKNMKVKMKMVLMMILKSLKHFIQEYFTKEKESTKSKFL